jgi:hypothetical protein
LLRDALKGPTVCTAVAREEFRLDAECGGFFAVRPGGSETHPLVAGGRNVEEDGMDAVVLARSVNGRNTQYVSKKTRRREKPLVDLTQPYVAGQAIRDGARLNVGPEEARSILTHCAFAGQRPTDPANLRGLSEVDPNGRTVWRLG